jgi:spore maturation protein CgeB
MTTIPTYIVATAPEAHHVGASFIRAAPAIHVETALADVRDAARAPKWIARVYWHLLDRRPPRVREFREAVERLQRETSAGSLVTTGVSPIDSRGISSLKARGVICANFATDDPWSVGNRARWFFRALPTYNVVFTPRRANVADLNRLGCARVEYLPFAYEPTVHFPEAPAPKFADRFGCDVAFIGGGDADRVPYVDALRAGGLSVRVYGAGWERYSEWSSRWGGPVFGGDYRQAVAHARLQLCLVRRANRDGHVMRSFELPAMRSCILAEDTPEHREIYGPPDALRVAYFSSEHEMVERAKRLVADEPLRVAMASRVFERVVERSSNTYGARFAKIVSVLEGERARRSLRGA